MGIKLLHPMDSDFRQNIITWPRLRLGLVLYSGYHPSPWGVTLTYIRIYTPCMHFCHYTGGNTMLAHQPWCFPQVVSIV